MAKKVKISVDPMTRIEGHLKVEAVVSNGKVEEARCFAKLFRGIEVILYGRDPRDAIQITQRICGVCPTAHATASVRALDDAFAVKPTTNGRIIRNIILGSNFVQSHILHFFHLALLDYIKAPSMPPFIPRYEGPGIYKLDKATNDQLLKNYLDAFDARRKAQEMLSLFAGKIPHIQGFIPGGVTEPPTIDKIVRYYWILQEVKEFVEKAYLPSVYAIAENYKELFSMGTGWKNLLCYGVFPLDDDEKNFLFKPGAYTNGKDSSFYHLKIKEFVKSSLYDDTTTGLHPKKGKTMVQPLKEGGYSYAKAPRYSNLPHEVGPLARMWITNPKVSKFAERFLGKKGARFRDFGDKAFSIMGRHIARAEEAWILVNELENWLNQVKPGEPVNNPYKMPENADGFGFAEAPRGSVGHWIVIKKGKISNYQIIAPTTWNVSPRDDKGNPGPIEKALEGIPVSDPKNPVNIARLVRAFDP